MIGKTSFSRASTRPTTAWPPYSIATIKAQITRQRTKTWTVTIRRRGKSTIIYSRARKPNNGASITPVTSLRQPLDQTQFQHVEQVNLSEKKDEEGGGEGVYDGETRNVRINSTEVQTMTPDIIDQHSGQPTPLTTRMNKDENFQVDMGQPYPTMKD